MAYLTHPATPHARIGGVDDQDSNPYRSPAARGEQADQSWHV